VVDVAWGALIVLEVVAAFKEEVVVVFVVVVALFVELVDIEEEEAVKKYS